MLDPRSPEEAVRNPIMHAVNIPVWELAKRTHELPARSDLVRVADVGPPGAEAVAWLAAHGRPAALCAAAAGGGAEMGRLWSPNAFLEEAASRAMPGTAIDLGCGSGRDAVYLASLGWRVRALDILPDALEKARLLEARYAGLEGRIEWEACDLSAGFKAPSPVDLAAMFFFLDRAALRTAAGVLSPGGTVVLETFSPLHRERFGKPHAADLVLSLDEAATLLPDLEMCHLDADWRPNGRHTVRAMWTRK